MIRQRMVRILLLASTITIGCQVAAVAHASGVQAPHATGQTLTVWGAQNIIFDSMKKTIAGFTQKTGIKVNFIEYPEGPLGDRLTTSMAAKDSSYDVFFEAFSLKAAYHALNGVAALDSFLKDPAQTPASWNYADFPAQEKRTCIIGGATYCLPLFADVTMLYYNKKYFQQAGLSYPPRSMAQMVADSVKLKTASHAGICMRGSVAAPNGFPGQMLMLYYLPYNDATNQGIYFDKNWNPELTTPQAYAFGRDYYTMLAKAGPRGIGNYGYQDCLTDFQQGRVAMFFDASDFTGNLLDRSASKVVGDTGFTVLPCPPTNPKTCSITAPWGGYVNQNSHNTAAAWQFLQYIESKQTESFITNDSGDLSVAVRNSVLASATLQNHPVPADLAAALKYGYSHVAANAFPNIPQFAQLDMPYRIALSKIVSGQASVQSALGAAQQQMVFILRRAGYLH